MSDRELPNPLKVLMFSVNAWAMVYFLSHMTPDAGAAHAPNFFIIWHWLMWWGSAIIGAISGALFVLFAGVWLSDPFGYKMSPTRGAG